MDESQKVVHCPNKSMQISLNKIGIMKGNQKFYWKPDFCRFLWRNWWACRDLINLASLIWKLHKHQNSIIRTIDLWSAFLAKRIQREVGTKAPFLDKKKKVKYTPKVKFIFCLSQVTSISNLSVSFLFSNNSTFSWIGLNSILLILCTIKT